MNLCIWIPDMTRYMYCWQYMSITCTVSHDFVYQYKAFGKPPGKPKNTGVGSLSLLQRIVLTQESNQGLLHCRRILYQLSYQGSPNHLGVHLIIQENLWGLKCISDSLFSGIIFFWGEDSLIFRYIFFISFYCHFFGWSLYLQSRTLPIFIFNWE